MVTRNGERAYRCVDAEDGGMGGWWGYLRGGPLRDVSSSEGGVHSPYLEEAPRGAGGGCLLWRPTCCVLPEYE